jgi:hypothetical protein
VKCGNPSVTHHLHRFWIRKPYIQGWLCGRNVGNILHIGCMISFPTLNQSFLVWRIMYIHLSQHVTTPFKFVKHILPKGQQRSDCRVKSASCLLYQMRWKIMNIMDLHSLTFQSSGITDGCAPNASLPLTHQTFAPQELAKIR